MRSRWTVRGPFGGVDLELGCVDARDTQARDRSEQELRLLLWGARHDLAAWRTLVSIRARLRAAPGRTAPPADAVADELLSAARAGRLLVRRRSTRAVVVPVALDTTEATRVLGPDAEPTAWIEIEVLDEDGEPVPDVEYRIEHDDGRVRTGTTNASGRAREDGLHEGRCNVTFPGLHGREWRASP